MTNDLDDYIDDTEEDESADYTLLNEHRQDRWLVEDTLQNTEIVCRAHLERYPDDKEWIEEELNKLSTEISDIDI